MPRNPVYPLETPGTKSFPGFSINQNTIINLALANYSNKEIIAETNLSLNYVKNTIQEANELGYNIPKDSSAAYTKKSYGDRQVKGTPEEHRHEIVLFNMRVNTVVFDILARTALRRKQSMASLLREALKFYVDHHKLE